ncbi:hypothetical protein [Bacteroides timonensis]|uniref:hypothetical protein n=1 Tax=Bacteroides timonensis TaxID=1470345 RepID=UPI0004AD2FA8|nr:hypothetical protein [Bacteroides timonensis]
MNRRSFMRTVGYSIGGISLMSLIHSCLPDDNFFTFEEKNNSDKSRLKQYLSLSNNGYYEKFPNVFGQRRALIVAEEVNFLENEDDLAKNKVDLILLIKTFAIIKCNFDFYSTENKIVNISQNSFNVYKITTESPSEIITYAQFPQSTTLRFPIKIMKRTPELVLDEKYSLPCIMDAKSFKRNFNITDVNTRSLNKIKIWES